MPPTSHGRPMRSVNPPPARGSATRRRGTERVARTVLAATLGLLPAVVAAAVVTAAPASADAPTSFDGTANAYGVDLTLYNPSLPLGLTVEAAGPTAQAHLNSIDQSDAFASFPYPGETTAGLPGTAGALFGVPTPAYPFIVSTQSGDAPKDQDLPGVALHAESGRSTAAGRATIGSVGTGFDSQARVETLSDGSVRASASTSLGVNLLNLIDISGMKSSASVTADATTGQLTRESHLSIGQISVPGLAIGVPDGTPGTLPIPIPVPGLPQLPPLKLPVLPLPLGGETIQAPDIGFEDGTFTITLPVPLSKPLKFAIPAKLVLDAFKLLGIDITYQTAQNTSTGVVAPALTFTYSAPSPPPNQYVNGKTDIGFTLGRSTASVTLQPAAGQDFTPGPGIGSGSSGGDLGGGGLNGGSGSGVDSGSVGSPEDSSGGLQGGGGDFPADIPSGDTSGSIASGPGLSSGGQTVTEAPQVLAALPVSDTYKFDLSGLYLVCVVIAAVALVSGAVLRLLGVRLL